jgi:hypothetical protein
VKVKEATFLERLDDIVADLSQMGETEMGNLSHAQAALFHNAVQMLKDLEQDLTE